MPLIPIFGSYVLSFLYVGIYWNNHHHLFQAVRQVNGTILWANLHLLFWLSLFPFVTIWVGEHPFTTWPLVLYGIVLLCAAIAYYILTRVLIAQHGRESTLAIALGRDVKGMISPLFYILAIPLAFVYPWLSYALYALVAIMWLIPDRRLERLPSQERGE